MNRLSRPRLVALLVLLFAVVQGAYLAAGVSFTSSTLYWFWQYLDPVLLRERLWESLFYLHSQPPLFNLFLGLVLNLFPDRYHAAFWGIYLLLGLGVYLALFALMRRLGVGRPLALLLALSAVAFDATLKKQRACHAFGFFFIQFLLGGTRNLFHPVHFLLAGALLLAACWQVRVRVLLAATLPLALLLSIPLKNYLLFDHFTASTWQGMYLARVTVKHMPPAERAALIESGRLSAVAREEPFSPLAFYPVEAWPHAADVPALVETRRTTGHPNYNHTAYIHLSDLYLADSLYVIRNHPQVYAKAVAIGWFSYFRSADDYYRTNAIYHLLLPNRLRMGPVVALYEYLLYGKVPFDLTRLPLSVMEGYSDVYFYVFLVLGLPLLWLYGMLVATGRAGSGEMRREQRWLVGYLCFNIAYVAVVGNLMEAGENNRFRFVTDLFSLLLLGLFLQATLLPRVRRTRSGRRTRGTLRALLSDPAALVGLLPRHSRRRRVPRRTRAR